MRDVVAEMIALGFRANEAQVYLSCLELGRATANDISQKSGIHRATTYTVLKGLVKKGLVLCAQSGDQRMYRAEGPMCILRLLDLQQRELEKRKQRAHETIERLQVFHNVEGKKPKIRYYERVTGLRAMQAEYEMLEDDMIQIVGLDTLKQLYDPENNQTHAQELKRKDRQVKTIIATKQDVSHLDLLDNFHYIVVDPDIIGIKGEMTVCGDRLVLFSYASTIMAVEIESKEIAQTARAALKLAWNEAKRLSEISLS